MVQRGQSEGGQQTQRRRERRESQRDQRRRTVAMKLPYPTLFRSRSLPLCVGSARRYSHRRALLQTQNTPMNPLTRHLFVKIRSHGHWVRWFRWRDVARARAVSKRRGEESAEKVNATNVGALLR